MNEIHPSLHLLLTGYFNQDWDLDAETPAEVVAHFVRDASESDVEGAIASVKSILVARDSEAAAESILKRTACQFAPSSMGLSSRGWLEWIGSQLEQRLKTM